MRVVPLTWEGNTIAEQHEYQTCLFQRGGGVYVIMQNTNILKLKIKV
jgi:hypothetical protein